VHEAFVPGHIDKAQHIVADRHVRIAELDRNTALDFLRQSIGIAPG
jgi:hypothetical protein